MLLELIIFALILAIFTLILAFAWNRYGIEELKMQVYDLNQEILQMRLSEEKHTTFESKESVN